MCVLPLAYYVENAQVGPELLINALTSPCTHARIQDFPEGANPKGWNQHIIRPKCSQNCMKMKKIGPRAGARVQNFIM